MNRYIVCSAVLAVACQLAHGGEKDFDSLGSSTSATAVFKFGGPFVDEIGDLVEGALPGGMSHAGAALVYSFGDSRITDNVSFNLYTDTIAPVEIESVTKSFTMTHGWNVLSWSLDDGQNGSVLGGVDLKSSFYWTVGFLDSDPHLSEFGVGMTDSTPLVGNWSDPTMMYIDFGTGLHAEPPNAGYEGPMGRVEITPEPSSFAFLGAGALGLLLKRRRK